MPASQQAMTAGAPPVAMAGALDAQRRRNQAFAVGAIVAVLLMGVLFALAKFGVLRLGAAEPDGGSLRLGGASGGHSLEKMASAGPPTLQKPAERIVMPNDIRDWLEHLHQTEIARVALTQKQVDDAMVEKEKLSVNGGADAIQDALNGINDPSSELHSPVDFLTKLVKKMHDECAALQDKFDAYPAPEECKPIQAAYDQALSETTSELGDLSDHLAGGDIDKLQSMKGESNSGIDAAGAKTDRLVGEICDKYDTKKWFSINKDIGTGSALEIPGF